MELKKFMKRLDYIDITKAYLILLVIIGHILIVLNPGYHKIYYSIIQEYIYSFHMSAFFIIHGILFNVGRWRKMPTKVFIFSRIYKLFVPYIFFEIIGIIWRFVLFKQDIKTGVYNLFSVRCNIGADWFLMAMFLGSLLFWIYIKYQNKIYGVISIVVAFVLPIYMNICQLTVVLGRAMLAYAFIMVGNFAKELFMSKKIKDIRCIIGALLLTGSIGLINLKFGGNDFYTCTVKNPITLLIGGISGTVLVVEISRLLQFKYLTIIGKHTLTIMGTHQLIIYAASVIFPKFSSGNTLYGVVLLIMILVFEIPVVYVIDNYLPFFVGRKVRNN